MCLGGGQRNRCMGIKRYTDINSLHSHLLLGAPINCPVLHSGVLCQSFNQGCNFHYFPHGVAPAPKEKACPRYIKDESMLFLQNIA